MVEFDSQNIAELTEKISVAVKIEIDRKSVAAFWTVVPKSIVSTIR